MAKFIERARSVAVIGGCVARHRLRLVVTVLLVCALGLSLLGAGQAWASSSPPFFRALAGPEHALLHERRGAIAATLPNGQVLIAGGSNPSQLSSAEVFNPATDTFSALTGPGQSLTERRDGGVAAALPNGQVLIMGGFNGTETSTRAEVFNPATDTFAKLAGPNQSAIEERQGAIAATLPNGQVLIAGGARAGANAQSAEIFNSSTDTFTKLGGLGQSLEEPRYGAISATLPSGEVLIAGGYNSSGYYLSSAELFNPETDTFTRLTGVGGSLTEARELAVATPLRSGQVLIAGGVSSRGNLSSAELFNPTTDQFTQLTGVGQALGETRRDAIAALLPSGQVLIAAGEGRSSAELFDPSTDIFTKITSAGQSLNETRENAVAVTLTSGQVLISGGYNTGGGLATAELLNPATYTFTRLEGPGHSPVYGEREGAVAANLPSGQVLIVGGSAAPELFNPSNDSFTRLSLSSRSSTEEERYGSVAATLPSGEILIAGGRYLPPNGGLITAVSSAELFNPATDTFTQLGGPGQSMTEPREHAVAAVLPSGQVLIAGGHDAGNILATAELFNPATDTFSKLTGTDQSLTEPRTGAIAATLTSGEILIAGGSNATGDLSSAELFNPVTDTFSKLTLASQSLTDVRSGAVAATLPSGEVLIAGGSDGNGYQLSTELFLPTAQTQIEAGGFGEQTVAEASAPAAVTVTSLGTQALSISGLKLGGANPSDFKVVADSCEGVKVAFLQVCKISVSFTPVRTGAVNATLTLADNEAEPAVVLLAGVGIPMTPREEEAARKRQEEEAARRRQELEAATLHLEEEAASVKRGGEEEAAVKKRLEEAAAALRRDELAAKKLRQEVVTENQGKKRHKRRERARRERKHRSGSKSGP